jgi:hypothetical protein
LWKESKEAFPMSLAEMLPSGLQPETISVAAHSVYAIKMYDIQVRK